MNLKASHLFTDLIPQYVEEVHQQKPGSAANVKSLLYKFARLIGRPLRIEELALDHDDLLDEIADSEQANPNSMRVMRSRVSSVADWAYRKGIVPVSPEMAERVGLLPRAEFADWQEHPRALTAYKLFVDDLAYAKLNADDIDDGFVGAFIESLDGRIANWRQCWLAFTQRWESLAVEGHLPEIDFPNLPSKKRGSYAVKEEDLPHHLQTSVAEMRSLFIGSDIEKRFRGKPFRSSTAELNIGSFCRLCGFLRNETQRDIASMSVRELLSLDNAKRLIDFTNKRALAVYGIKIGPKDSMEYGEYERSTLLQLSAIVREYLKDELLHEQYLEEVRHIAALVNKRREALKQPGHPDDYMRVALEVWKRADDAPSVTAATLRRDALIIALIALFTYRVGVVARFKVDEHIRLSDDKKSGIICIPRTQTKPGKRDLMHEIPPEMIPMVLRVIEEREILLGNKAHHGHLFVAQGGSALGKQAIYTMFRTRTQEILGTARNPHQARKAWGTAWGMYSGGDFITGSAIMDSRPLTIQRSYAKLNVYKKHADHDTVVHERLKAIRSGIDSVERESA